MATSTALVQSRVGYVETRTDFEKRDELKVLSELGVELVPIEMPTDLPASAVSMMLGTEVGAVFDPLMRDGTTDGLNTWPRVFRKSQFIPAVEYLRASRVRTLMMRAMEEVMEDVDLYVAGDDLVLTNLTGHPTVVLPNGFYERKNGRKAPRALTFTGRLYGESELLSVAHSYQMATEHHLPRPDIKTFLKTAKEN